MDRKSQILKIISENPGIYQGELIHRTDIAHGVLAYYLDRLESAGLIKSQKSDRYRRYYPLEMRDEEICILRNLRKKAKKEIVLTILVRGDPTFSDLIEATTKSPATISWNISGLIKEGIIEKHVRGRKTTYRIRDREMFLAFFKKYLPHVFNEQYEHVEDVFLAL